MEQMLNLNLLRGLILAQSDNHQTKVDLTVGITQSSQLSSHSQSVFEK